MGGWVVLEQSVGVAVGYYCCCLSLLVSSVCARELYPYRSEVRISFFLLFAQSKSLYYLHLRSTPPRLPGIMDPLVLMSRSEEIDILREVAAAINCLSSVEENKMEVADRSMCTIIGLMLSGMMLFWSFVVK